MKTYLISPGAVVALALLLAGCESDNGLAARKQEKSAAYATARTWQKSFIEEGVIAQGFTPDLVYIALGKPSKIETKELAEGHAELWTYNQVYPNVDAVHGFRHADFTTESAYQPQRALTQSAPGSNSYDPFGPKIPMGMSQGGGESIAKTGVAQGGSMEPAALRSYTIKVLFAGNKVVQIGADENPN